MYGNGDKPGLMGTKAQTQYCTTIKPKQHVQLPINTSTQWTHENSKQLQNEPKLTQEGSDWFSVSVWDS